MAVRLISASTDIVSDLIQTSVSVLQYSMSPGVDKTLAPFAHKSSRESSHLIPKIITGPQNMLNVLETWTSEMSSYHTHCHNIM